MKISAFIPCFNSGRIIARTIASVRSQSPPVDELFVVDDSSRDNSAEIVSSMGVKVIRFTRNLGRGAVRARGIEEAKCDFLLCCDAGKEIGPAFLENAITWFEHPRVAAVFAFTTQSPPVTPVDRWRGRHLYRTPLPEVAHGAALATGGCLLRASAVKDVGNFSMHLRQGEDADLGGRLLAAGYDVICDPRLVLLSCEPNSLEEVLERYWRWNTAPHGRMGIRDYLRQILFSIRVMARADMCECDPAAAMISLISPHYQFWIPLLRRWH